MDKKILIVGIDPGTTLGYAVLDIDSKIIKIKSSKQMNLNSLISEIINLGSVIVVGTDKAKVPGLVELFAVKTGGKVIRPEEDLKVSEKKRLILDYKVKDEHQGDALASALFAYKEERSLLKKIKVFTRNNKKEEIRGRIIDLVVTKGVSIRQAVDIIEKPAKEEVKIIKNVVEERKLSQADFLRLYNKAKRCEKEILFLRKQNSNLSRELKNVMEKHKYIAKKVDRLRSDEKAEELINFKEKRIRSFDKEVKFKEEEIELLQEKINNLNLILSKLNENYLLKKLNNLGSFEFGNKNKFLNIKEGDILLVDELNIFNNKVVEKIKNNVKVIIYKNKLNKTTKRLPFVFINSGDLDLTEEKHFAIVNKEMLNKEINKANIFSRVVEDYKNERIAL
ncbi:MAG: DUF460 domain-containing protein [Nanoarchaeota archaeon]|nr:DUF460 domain-containing protein [Nanoarchaeota archaeon]